VPSPLAGLKRYPALLLLVVTYAISCGVVATNMMRAAGRGSGGEEPRKVLRFAHWQLEPGIRKALDDLIAEYEELHPDTEVRQILIPEEGYFQWVNTQLIGRTAPDMIECGQGGTVAWALWPKFYARYFLPLDRYVDEPNPYNDGTPLEGVPWRETFFDEMDGGYDDSLQSYFRVPLSAFTQRLYYNKPLVEKVWGAEFPATYEEFIELCQALRAHGRERGRELVPIAGSGYNFRQFFDAFRTALTADYLDRLDKDYDGYVSRIESAGPFYSGKLSFAEEPIRANFELVRELSEYFPQGYTSLDRDESVWMFVQEDAAMISTGSWDFQSLHVQTPFDIAIAEIPLPSKDNPQYGRYVAGPQTEAGIEGGFPMAVTKTSKHADQALDFLRFASSLPHNEKLNRQMYWLPVARGAEPREELKPFAPRIEGFNPTVQYEGPGVELTYGQMRPEFLSGKIPYDEFVDTMEETYRRESPKGIYEYMKNNEQTLIQQMRAAALRRADMLGAVGASASLTGDSSAQYKRIMEAYVSQLGGFNNEIRVWSTNRALVENEG
jgi:raffinose/stachyose/melibiose transport system substrate-binding protein